jgi:hypothetical protein
VEALNFIGDGRKRERVVRATDKARASVAQDARHMTNKFARRTGAIPCLEQCELRWRTAQRLLSPVRQGSKKVRE